MAEDWRLTDDEAVAAEDAALSASYGAFGAKRAALADAAQAKLWAHIWRLINLAVITPIGPEQEQVRDDAISALGAMNAALGQKEQS